MSPPHLNFCESDLLLVWFGYDVYLPVVAHSRALGDNTGVVRQSRVDDAPVGG